MNKYLVHVEGHWADDIWVDADSAADAVELAKDVVREQEDEGAIRMIIESSVYPAFQRNSEKGVD